MERLHQNHWQKKHDRSDGREDHNGHDVEAAEGAGPEDCERQHRR